MTPIDWQVDNSTHLLHGCGQTFPCDRDIEALAQWNGCALLLSSDTDCLSLWDADGLIRTAQVGVYPQDMAARSDIVCVCGGADGRLYLLALPTLKTLAELPLPGMPERICLRDDTAWVLTLLPEPEPYTALLSVSITDGHYDDVLHLPGIPGAIATDSKGLWIGVSELLLRLPWGDHAPDLVIDGIELPRSITASADHLVVTDALTNQTYLIRT